MSAIVMITSIKSINIDIFLQIPVITIRMIATTSFDAR